MTGQKYLDYFDSKEDFVRYSSDFLHWHTRKFKKDMKICLKSDWDEEQGKNTHAYMPAFFLCITFWEFLAGLWKGEIYIPKKNRIPAVVEFGRRFFKNYNNRYTDNSVRFLYIAWRNQIAHIGHPHVPGKGYGSSDDDKNKRLVTFDISEEERDPPVEFKNCSNYIDFTKMSQIPKWKIQYDSVLKVSLPSLRDDLLCARENYARKLEKDDELQSKFTRAVWKFHSKPKRS